jgi:hypothetical protein
MPTVEQFKRIKEILRGAVPLEEEKVWLQPLGYWPGDRLVGTAFEIKTNKKLDLMIPRKRFDGYRHTVVETTKEIPQQTWFSI